MSDDRAKTKKREQVARAERLAAALRENLKRRKAQSRGRTVKPTKDAPDHKD
ncbi:MAG TPA: hypothetical protein VN930_11915 [Xanthobacteraceae bacterium]|nr:hypothetical protein [Xanthobacteraceae bacterium]